MKDYDAAKPILDLLRSPDEWIKNRMVVQAFGLKGRRGCHSLIGNFRGALASEIAGQVMYVQCGSRQNVYFSKYGIILAALRLRSDATLAFRFFVAETVMMRVTDPPALRDSEVEALADDVREIVAKALKRVM